MLQQMEVPWRYYLVLEEYIALRECIVMSMLKEIVRWTLLGNTCDSDGGLSRETSFRCTSERRIPPTFNYHCSKRRLGRGKLALRECIVICKLNR